MKQLAYQYKNLPIPGGGYVTGFLFHPEKENLLYIRTDIGGSYHFDYECGRWESLSEAVTMFDLSQTYPIALSVDRKKPERLFIVSGENHKSNGIFSISQDYGKTFQHKMMPCYVHGNMNGRGTGLRLIKDPLTEGGIYFASQKDGLLYTPDLGDHWIKLPTGEEAYMTCIWVSDDGHTIITGTAGVTTGTEEMRGHSLYVSYNMGKSFEPLPMPDNKIIKESVWSGYVAHRYDYDGTYLYITLVNTGARSYVKEMGYSCDSGDVLGGRILRYSFGADGRVTGYEDITPKQIEGMNGIYEASPDNSYAFGFGGIGSCKTKPGLLAASTLCKEDGDILFVSFDYGNTWEAALYDLSIGNLTFETSYMLPEYNGGHSLIHWLSDVKINPFNPDEVWFNTGTGVFVSKNFTKADRSFQDCCKGIEETVHLNVYSPVAGPVQALDIVGDLGGFAFTDLDRPCANSFADEEGNRYITCMNADYSDLQPETVVVTPRGNWKGKTKGGLILSRDYGLTFERLPLPYGISDYLDERFRQIERPNVNSGWAALSSDTKTIVYCVAENIDLFMKGIIVSNDTGKTFRKVMIYDESGKDMSFSSRHMKVYADRINPDVFYGFGDGFTIFISTDKGNTFYQADTASILSEDPSCKDIVFGLIDCANRTEVRGDSGKEGVFYIAVSSHGLWKLELSAEKKKVNAGRITQAGETVYRVGLGLLSPESSYLSDDKALYIAGEIQGIYGFFRSLDDGKSWEKLNDDTQMFGQINSIDGDSRTFGRFFIATGSFGVKCGEPLEQS